MKKLFVYLGLLVGWVAQTGAAADELWLEDAEKAVAQAQEDQKDLLLLYTGSDWCPPCMKLEKEVFATDEFKSKIADSHILLKFDFPQNTQQSIKLVEQNAEWSRRYGVDGYPTVVLVDSQLRPYGFAGYEGDGAAAYLAMIDEMLQTRIRRDELLKQAEDHEGLERATLLDQAMSVLREELVSVYYSDIVEEIVELDSGDELGLRSKWNEAKDNEMRKIIITDIVTVARLEQPERAIDFIDEVTGEIDFTGDQRLQILQIKLNLLQKLRRNDDVNALLDEMISLEGVDGTVRERLIVKKVLLMTGNDQRDAAMNMLEEALADGGDNLFLWLAKGELLDSESRFDEAIQAYDKAIPKSRHNPDLLADLVGARADALYDLDQSDEALQILDGFAKDPQMPSDLRSEILLHKSMMLRDLGRTRLARLAENQAIEIAESPNERSEIQQVVDQLQRKYEKATVPSSDE